MSRTKNVDRLDREVKEVTDLLKNNVEKVLERGERIETLQERSEDLESSSIQFRSSSKRLRRKMCCQNCRMTCLLIVVITAIIVIVTIIILVSLKPWQTSHSSGNHHGNHSIVATKEDILNHVLRL